MRSISRVLVSTLFLLSPMAAAQQVALSDYDPKITAPAFAGEGPVVAIDGAHQNFHTIEGRYAPFATLVRADGYRPRALTEAVTASSLAGTAVLVIANARQRYAAPEIAVIRGWVEQGGSLLLIADHTPFGTATTPLAAAFGVEMGNGYVAVRQDGKVTSRIAFSGRLLGTHPIVTGPGPGGRVRRVETFTGQSLSVPAGATALLTLPEDALEVAGPPQVDALRRGESAPGQRVGGRAQAVALELAKGRVVIAGEAAMFTAQQMKSGAEVGLDVADDQRFVRNVMAWLARAMP